MTKVPEAGYPIEALPDPWLPTARPWRNIGLPWRVLKSLGRHADWSAASSRMWRWAGGYASGPTLAAAQRAAAPTLVQEQNSFPGPLIACSPSAPHRICVAYEGMDRWFPGEKVLLTGNPVRQEAVRLAGKGPRGLEHFGLREDARRAGHWWKPVHAASTGASRAPCRHSGTGAQAIWQTGTVFQQEAAKAVQELGFSDCHVHPFLARMDLASMPWRDLVVARAGAISVSELCLVQRRRSSCRCPPLRRTTRRAMHAPWSDCGAAMLVQDANTEQELGPAILGAARR